MKKRNLIESDPVVADARRARAALWRKGGGTPEGFSRVTSALARAQRAKRGKRASRSAASRRGRKAA